MAYLQNKGARTRLFYAVLGIVGVVVVVWQFTTLGRLSSLETRNIFNFSHEQSCTSLVNQGSWATLEDASCNSPTPAAATCGGDSTYHWLWDTSALTCGAHRFTKQQLRAKFKDSWLVVAGDSIGRFFFAALLRFLSDSGIQDTRCMHKYSQAGEHQIIFGHRDFEYILPGSIRATFLWAPYSSNLTAQLNVWSRASRSPDYLVMSCGLWHMLHITDPVDFAQTVNALKVAASALEQLHAKIRPLPMAFFSITEVYPPRLKTEEKRQHLTPPAVDAYNRVINTSGILSPKGPLHLIDMHHLTQGCGPSCTHDGLHYSNTTYDLAVQIFANTVVQQAE